MIPLFELPQLDFRSNIKEKISRCEYVSRTSSHTPIAFFYEGIRLSYFWLHRVDKLGCYSQHIFIAMIYNHDLGNLQLLLIV